MALFEVGSVFTIVDEASPVLRKLAEQLGALDEMAKTLQTSLSAIVTINAELGQSFTSINRRMTGTIDRMERLSVVTKEYQAAAAAGMVEGGFMGGGGRRGGGGSAGGGHGTNYGFAGGVGKGMGLGSMLTHPATFIGGYVAFEGMKTGAEEDLAATQALIALRQPVTTENIEAIKNMSAQARKRTIFTEAQVTGTMPGLAGLLAPFGFTGADSMEKMNKILPTLAQGAEVAVQQIQGSDLQDNILAFGKFAHMTGRYEGQGLIDATNTMLNISEATHTAPKTELTTLAKAIPLARAAHINPDEMAEAVGAFQSMGLGGPSGMIWSNILLGLTKQGGALSGHVDSMQGELESELGFRKGGLKGAKEKVNTHDLKELGIMDKDGHLLVLDEDGHIKPMEILRKVAEYGKSHDPNEALGMLYGAFGMRGVRGLGISDDPATFGLMTSFLDYISKAPTATAQQGILSQTDAQTYERVWTDTKMTFTILGNVLEHTFAPAANALVGVMDRFIAAQRPDSGEATIFSTEGVGIAANELASQYADGFNEAFKLLWTSGDVSQLDKMRAKDSGGNGATNSTNAAITNHYNVNINSTANNGAAMHQEFVNALKSTPMLNTGATAGNNIGIYENAYSSAY